MRVTQGMLNDQLLRDYSNSLERMGKWQKELSSGKKINAPSDDPVGIGFSLRYRNDIAANEQYQKNTSSAMSWLEETDTTLGQVTDLWQRARELAVQGANSPNPDQAMDSIASEISQLYEELVQIGNTEFNGKYIFNGQKTDIPPYATADAATRQTETSSIRYEIGTGSILDINVTGEEVFGLSGDTLNMFQILKDLETALNNSDHAEVSNIIERIDLRMDSLLTTRADVGARVNRVELADNRLKDMNVSLNQLLSDTEDADIAQTITNLKTEESVYQSSLSTGARIIQPSLVDFIK